MVTECPTCGPVEHVEIPEDEAHCPCLGWCSCPCHGFRGFALELAAERRGEPVYPIWRELTPPPELGIIWGPW